jgi:hypothetical protein
MLLQSTEIRLVARTGSFVKRTCGDGCWKLLMLQVKNVEDLLQIHIYTPHPTSHFHGYSTALQELNTNTEAQSLPALFLRPHDERQAEVDLEARNRVRIYETKTRCATWQLIC